MLSLLRQSRTTLFCLVLCSCYAIGPVYGQFTTILDIPPEPDIGDFEEIGSDTQLNLSAGGAIGFSFDAGAANGTSTHVEVNISGGSVGNAFDASGGSVVNISGSSVGRFFDANSGSEVNLFGTRFVLDSIDITASLTTNVPFTITDRDVTLNGLLADGSGFSFDLNSTNISGQDYFDPLALLTVTLVEAGDCDGNLVVDGADFLRWQRGQSPDPFSASDLADWEANYGMANSQLAGDFNFNGVVDGKDFPLRGCESIQSRRVGVGQIRVLALYPMRRFAEKKRCDNAWPKPKSRCKHFG